MLLHQKRGTDAAVMLNLTTVLARKGTHMPKSNPFADTISSAQADLEKIVGDLRSVLSNKDLDNVPEIRQLRQRLDDTVGTARDSAVRAAQDAARQAKEAALAADRYAHDEPWRVAGAALAVGALVGFIFSRR